MRLRIATRKSPLALAQARWVADQLSTLQEGLTVEEVRLETRGDQLLDRPLAKAGGKGLFVAEVEQALRRGDADIAVHSMKDVPETLVEGFDLACIPEREDPGDLLLSPGGQSLFDLPEGACVGTSSLRRACQLKAARPEVRFRVLRGNVGTRLRRLEEGLYDAIVLAAAGLRRLPKVETPPSWRIPPEVCLPAVGQGALGIEAGGENKALRHLLSRLEDAPTRICVEAERACSQALGASCTSPVAAHARWTAKGLELHGVVAAVDGSKRLCASESSETARADMPVLAARALGDRVARKLLHLGARALLTQAAETPDPYTSGAFA